MHPGACIFGCSGKRLLESEREFFEQVRPLGFILFDRNAGTVDEIRDLTSELRSAAGHDAPVLTDHEGGRVQRLRGAEWREWPPALDECAKVDRLLRPRLMWLRYRMIAHELAGVGITGNCVPLADVADGDTHAVLRNRCYGSNPAEVARIARAVADGNIAGGVLPVLKHIPGHGGTGSDSHVELPVNLKSLEQLEQSEFQAFRALNDLPLGMTAHVVYKALDAKRPATVSPVVIEYIRDEIGFDGLLMTDDISMSALAGPMEERVAAALESGCDAVLHCNGDLSEMRKVAGMAGKMTVEARVRLDGALRAIDQTSAADMRALSDEFADITKVLT